MDAQVPSLLLERTSFSSSSLSHLMDDLVQGRGRAELTDSMRLEAAQFVDLLDESEDEGEIMLMAMILLQLHGVKFHSSCTESSSSPSSSSSSSPASSSSSSVSVSNVINTTRKRKASTTLVPQAGASALDVIEYEVDHDALDEDHAGGAEDDRKKKRQRTSPDQLAILEQIFLTDKMPSQHTRVQLAEQLGMSSRRVQIWFQNKRAKVKRGGLGRSSDDIQATSDGEGSVESPTEQQLPASPSAPLTPPSPPGTSSSVPSTSTPTSTNLNNNNTFINLRTHNHHGKTTSSNLNQQLTSSSVRSTRSPAPFPFVSRPFEAPPMLVPLSY